MKPSTQSPVIQQLLFRIRTDLPMLAMKAWIESLSDAERQEVVDHIREAMATVAEATSPLVDALREAGAEVIQGIAEALTGAKVADLDLGSEIEV